MSVNVKMTAISDKIRGLLGITGKMGLDAMNSNLGDVVNECDTQANLIAQIKTALEGKAAGGGEGAGGMRRIQFVVTLAEAQSYLPLAGLTEIPEILTITGYDAAAVCNTTGYGGDTSVPSAGHITTITTTILPLKQVGNNSGTRVRLQSASVGEYMADTMLRGYQYFNNTGSTDRYDGYGAGWVQPVNIPDTTWQSAFVSQVAYVGYMLSSDGVLCLKSAHSNAKTFAENVAYLVTALYDVIPPTVDGYIELDRTVNSTNVTTVL